MLKLNLINFLVTSIVIFCTGICGLVLNRKNILLAIMSLELLLLSVNFNFLLFSIYLDDLYGSIFVILILTIAASESALGLSLLTLYYRKRQTIEFEFLRVNKLKV